MALRLRACAHERSRPKPTGGRRDLCRRPGPKMIRLAVANSKSVGGNGGRIFRFA